MINTIVTIVPPTPTPTLYKVEINGLTVDQFRLYKVLLNSDVSIPSFLRENKTINHYEEATLSHLMNAIRL